MSTQLVINTAPPVTIIAQIVGAIGPGVPIGGTVGQVLTKTGALDFQSQWVNPLSMLAFTYTSTVISYAILITDQIIKATGIGITLTLPTAIGITGKEYTIDNAANGSVYLTTSLAQTINGIATQLLLSNSSITVYSDGANWRII